MVPETVVAAIAVVVAIASLLVSVYSERQRRKADAIKELLGDKESIAFAASRLLRDGLPHDATERAVTYDAVVQACVFEKSDRSRALLYRVLDKNRTAHGVQIGESYRRIKGTFDSMATFKFPPNELDLSSGLTRLGALERLLGAETIGAAPPSDRR